MSEPILKTEGLTKRFGSFVAVDGVDLEVKDGELRGLIGPNGAGKTTVLNTICGLLEPTSGRVLFNGEDITNRPPHEIVSMGMSMAFQITSIFPELTVEENVLGALNSEDAFSNVLERYGTDPEKLDRVERLLERVGLEAEREETAGTLSHGDQKVLELALALAGDPDLLLLDEPTAGLSASETNTIRTLLEDLRGDIAIVLIEHDMELVMDVVDSVTVLHNGRILVEGSPEEIRDDEQVKNVYFGRDH